MTGKPTDERNYTFGAEPRPFFLTVFFRGINFFQLGKVVSVAGDPNSGGTSTLGLGTKLKSPIFYFAKHRSYQIVDR